MLNKNLWLNRFEIPLTMLKTDSVFDVIQNIKYNNYIQSVYLPLHGEDGLSGRSFYKATKESSWIPSPGYNKSKKEWIKLIKEISNYKPVILTMPFVYNNIDLIKEYIDYGISEIMISHYWDDLDKLKSQIKISRSIAFYQNSDEPIDERFTGVVIPYKKALDKEWLEENSKKFELTAIINHCCLVDCPAKKYKDTMMYRITHNLKYKQPRGPECYRYKNTTTAMLPREIVMRIEKYVSRFKLIERLSEPALYINFLNYYIYNENFSLETLETPEVKEISGTQIKMMMDKENNFRGSNLETLNCKFECGTCDKKCYSISDWTNDYINQFY